MNRTKILIVVGCILGLALAWIPAYASPTNKKITVTCTSPIGDEVTGTVTITLCSSIDLTQTDPCVGPTVCWSGDAVLCDSLLGPTSTTMPCAASSKVGGVSFDIGCTDTNGTCIGNTNFVILTNGKGTVVSGSNPDDGDGVSVTIK